VNSGSYIVANLCYKNHGAEAGGFLQIVHIVHVTSSRMCDTQMQFSHKHWSFFFTLPEYSPSFEM
jgi:hypothetical protein